MKFVNKFENLLTLSEVQFRRLTGVKRKTFDSMVTIVRAAEQIKKRKGVAPVSSRYKTESR